MAIAMTKGHFYGGNDGGKLEKNVVKTFYELVKSKSSLTRATTLPLYGKGLNS